MREDLNDVYNGTLTDKEDIIELKEVYKDDDEIMTLLWDLEVNTW